MGGIFRCFVEKKADFDAEALAAQGVFAALLGLTSAEVRLFNRYDIQNLPESARELVKDTVLNEPMAGTCYDEELPPLAEGTRLLCVEPLPGQFDIRADSCEQCVQMLIGGERPVVRTAKVYAVTGVDERGFERIKQYMINPIECREASAEKPQSLERGSGFVPEDIAAVEGFTAMNAEGLDQLACGLGLAMSPADLLTVQAYFTREGRNPSHTELRVLDTYWSDHCRHTTFNTVIDDVSIEDERVQNAYEQFKSVNSGNVTLMRIATAAMKHLRARGLLDALDVSDEVNACTIRVPVQFPDKREEWLLMFKNETHNHPTEIEPFGGAATCIGGAIRDPLSGRSYVYQSMRITGAGNPFKPLEQTLPGKLPQRRIIQSAAEGFSSYGNQIGLNTGYVREIYHDKYEAKRLEAGAVVGAAPADTVRREAPCEGDIVLLLGGRTGRDGIGGATGSSKTHGTETVSECASEVQKGNAPEERKLQRLFRNPDFTRLVKRCNDFGAGGVAVAVGELAEGLVITLDAVPVKYVGLDGTELAISESQERMAVVVEAADARAVKALAEEENIETTEIARVTGDRRLVMQWRGKTIVDLKRDFLDTNGAERRMSVAVRKNTVNNVIQSLNTAEHLKKLAADLNFCSRKGLVQHFDCTIGASNLFAPFGGKYMLTETQVMASAFPARDAKTASVMAYGFDPFVTEADPFGGSVYAVVSSVAKLIASGVKQRDIYLSLQEYFPSVKGDKERFGVPFAAMLGAFSAQMGLGIAAVGGKDSMSGSFGTLDVPPTLISFAVGTALADSLISPEFKGVGHPVYLLRTPLGDDNLPDYEGLRRAWDRYNALLQQGRILSAWSCEAGGIAGGIMKMSLGNMIGFKSDNKSIDDLFGHIFGSLVFEASEVLPDSRYELLGYTNDEAALVFAGERVALAELRELWEAAYENLFPERANQHGDAPSITSDKRFIPAQRRAFARPKAVIPVFPGTNCEYDTAAYVEQAGGIAEVVVVRNLTPDMLRDSVSRLEKAINGAQMVIFPGGFSGADEPDGSAKFIVSLIRNERLTHAVHSLLDERQGLILGICNGFQALIKLGLVPYGRIMPMTADSPTLTQNRIGRYQGRYISSRVSSVLSPWLSRCEPGQMYVQPIACGEGRLAASDAVLNSMKDNGQIAFQYTDYDGNPSMDVLFNPVGSAWAIEGITSPDGRVLGKMAHTERFGRFTGRNIPNKAYFPLFEGGVDYFK